MITWIRESGSSITLEDTPNMKAFAKSAGWTKAKKEKSAKEVPENDKIKKEEG